MRPTRRASHDRPTARLARRFWAAPCSLVGLFFAAPLLLFGAKAAVCDGILEVTWRDPMPPGSAVAPWLKFRAITLGHVVIAVTRAELIRLRAHERVHVRQYERWGIGFFVAYAASSIRQALKGGDPYWDNRFEVEARALSAPAEDAEQA
jgi:hypothetical protein